MGKADIRLTADIRDVLESATYSDQWMTLPETPIYAKVKKFLEHLGAYWVRKDKAHIWNAGIKARYEQLLESGGFTDKKKKLQQYYTSAEVVEEIIAEPMRALERHGRPVRIMEPSAGAGAFANEIAEWLRIRTVVRVGQSWPTPESKLVCVEIDPDNVKALKEQGHQVLAGDFLALEPKASSLCDYIFMNPPFTSGQDMAHVSHAFRFLKPGGELFAIVSGNAGMGQNRQHQAFADLIGQYCGSCDYLESGAFANAGTQVRTKVLHFTHPDF